MTNPAIECSECGAVLSSDFYSADPARRHYFAVIRRCWETLPDDKIGQFASPEHLRKHCLIKAGWCDTTMMAMGSKGDAIKVAALVPQLDRYAVGTVQGSVVMISVARSQTRRAQPKPQFLETAEAVYRILGEMLGVSADDLARVA